jgi:hypothetical protein
MTTTRAKTSEYLAPTYSFCVPGLGQVFQTRYVAGLAWFTAFVLFNFFWAARFSPRMGFFSLLISLGSAREALHVESRRKSMARQEPWTAESLAELKGRPLAFTVVGVFGFLLWFFSVSSSWLPLGSALTLQAQAQEIGRLARRYREKNGTFPSKLEDLGKDFARSYGRDPWGSEFSLQREADGLEVRSPGPDRARGTSDDAVFHFSPE